MATARADGGRTRVAPLHGRLVLRAGAARAVARRPRGARLAGRGLARRADALAAARVRASRDWCEQLGAAAAVQPRLVPALPEVGLAVRGRRDAAERPDALPARRGGAAAVRGRPAGLPALAA